MKLELIFETAIKASLEQIAIGFSNLETESDKYQCDKYTSRIIWSLSETKKERDIYFEYYQGKKK